MSEVLAKARAYEAEAEQKITKDERPAVHFSPRIGWLNDPNGFSYYNGTYHLYYQYYPYSSHWGPMHWGHATSDDLVHWNYLPAALAPDEYYDKDGCFSGTALTLEDGRQLLMYTGFRREEDAVDERGVQTQNIAIGDGLNFIKHVGNPVLTEEDLPEGGDRYEFRDPKIWQEKDGSFRSIMVSRNQGKTQVLMYASPDALEWKLHRILYENHDEVGLMWECPDFFELDGRYVLLSSAMDMLASGSEFHSGNNGLYLIGDYDTEKEEFTPEVLHTMDFGIDMYAAQTTVAPDGRRILIGWMQNPDTTSLRTVKGPLFGQMSIPRELSVQGDRLYQMPVRELEAVRHDPVHYEHVLLESKEQSLEGIQGRIVDLEFTLRPGVDAAEGEAGYKVFRCRFARNDSFYTELSYYPEESLVRIDRKYSGQRRAIIRHRDVILDGRKASDPLKVRLILDRYSAEAFINDGERVMTITFITDPAADEITFQAEGRARMDITKYSLEDE